MSDVLDRYVDSSYTYRFTQGPGVVRTHEDALRDGINCVSLAHLALLDLFNYELPSELQCTEMFLDRQHFTDVRDISQHRLGDLFWFGVDDAVVEPTAFVPIYDDKGNLTNWKDFPIKHVAVATGRVDDSGDPLLLHSTHIEGTNSIWPMRKFGDYRRYRKLHGRRALPVGAPGAG